METGINNLKDLFQIIIWLIGAGSLAVAAYSYYLSKKQLNFAVIIKCTERFQNILPQLESEDENERRKGIGLYLDLCNEELFYFKYKYLPKEIIEEWTDGMLEYLPYYNSDSERNLNENKLSQEIENHLSFKKNPRIRKAFTIETTTEETRKHLVANVKKRLKEIN